MHNELHTQPNLGLHMAMQSLLFSKGQGHYNQPNLGLCLIQSGTELQSTQPRTLLAKGQGHYNQTTHMVSPVHYEHAQ